MTVHNLVDVHCHFFNGWYALREAVAIGWNLLLRRYPYADDADDAKETTPMEYSALREREDWRDFLDYVGGFLRVISQQCDLNHKEEMCAFEQSQFRFHTNLPLITTPLMMDIYFILCDNKHEASNTGKQEQRRTWIPPTQEELAAFEKYLTALKADVLHAAEKDARAIGVQFDPTLPGRLSDELDLIREECLDWEDSKVSPQVLNLSPGYRKHMRDLESLKEAYPTLIFPFLAVDPRRRGIMDLIKDKVRTGDGPFKGIKLYPPLGYLPSHPELMPIYTYCTEHDIPITTHASSGGLGNFRKSIFVRGEQDPDDNRWVDMTSEARSACAFFADPKRWRTVLESKRGLRNLRLNFAHFGQDNDWPWGSWATTISEILVAPREDTAQEGTKYPNIYCDNSFFTNPSHPAQLLGLITNRIIGERLMFGTDFVMIMMDQQAGGIGNYFNMYSEFPMSVLRDNAKSFLKLDT